MRKTTWLISLMPPALSLIILRTYLGYFNNGSLFTENLSTTGIFNYVFIFMILTTTGAGFIFFLPSLIFCLSLPKNVKTIHNYRDIKSRISQAALLSFPLTVFTFFLWAYLSSDYPNYEPALGWFFALVGGSLVILINYLFLRQAAKNAQELQRAKAHRKIAFWLFIGSPLLIFTIILCFTFCVGTIIKWVDTQVAGDSIITILKLAALISGLGVSLILPGAVYVNTDKAAQNESWHIRFTLVSVIFWLLITNVFVSSFYPVLIDKMMSFAGISDWQTRRFQVEESKLPASHFSHQDWHIADNIPGRSYTVQGIMVYSLNNVRLLCPESIREQYRHMLQFVPWDRVYAQNKSNELKKASARCQPFVQGGITRLSEK
ncbi:hypothetical protein [Escherichia coli]|uniref:hypothetical protein n=1 Tax=Escherichia coli TaxID=562 RepID=UPI001991F6CC|nr:hypothetical protein [Escherichia coli]CAD6081924.1 Uncharacterised protein [Escherichia coli]CAD6086419.1 Uncharacterised protein [Escherichia coli]CAD6149446.1 Uncharacterised protein [Escherichia coli]